MSIHRGARVEADAYGGKITRRVVAQGNGMVYVCRDDEWEAAVKEGREPIAVGFKADRVRVVQ